VRASQARRFAANKVFLRPLFTTAVAVLFIERLIGIRGRLQVIAPAANGNRGYYLYLKKIRRREITPLLIYA
jgi:hypothetical protein